MKENKFIKYQLTILFLLIIMVPFFFNISGVKGFDRKDENRTFSDSVSLNINKLDNFPGDYDAYAKDNFFFRTPMLNYFHQMKFNIFNISPHPEKAIIGKDGWMFKSGREIDIINGNSDFSPETLDSFSNEWKERMRYYEELDIPVFWIIAPIKQRIYKDKLPYSVFVSETNRIESLKAHFKKDFPNLIIDPSDLLKAKRDSFKVYYQLDNHWNDRAGYYISNLLIEKLRAEFPTKTILDIPKITWEIDENHKEGFHHRVMGIDELSEINETAVIDNPQAKEAKKYGFESIKGFAYPWDYENRFINKDLDNGIRVLFIRDSFALALRQFLKEAFKESVFIFDAWQFKVNEEIVERMKPDVVVYIGLETNIENFLKDYE
ncbi:hypothetical protein ERX46_05085 [Brumimicrobium glaciale]|uniref:AlgX/AlgJ SGNH hydrolase-like domain-containing protein n=1 Tax=Brumimicrobium glaciale TaxID=200475 RepID=A0A4Q4KP34_9FLAO|nr:hypothetical protein [Brumimicrobium glaciale]RYM34750.1 hypothetical protein ERX46_05085 [Brumimicrobium glaciale]